MLQQYTRGPCPEDTYLSFFLLSTRSGESSPRPPPPSTFSSQWKCLLSPQALSCPNHVLCPYCLWGWGYLPHPEMDPTPRDTLGAQHEPIYTPGPCLAGDPWNAKVLLVASETQGHTSYISFLLLAETWHKLYTQLLALHGDYPRGYEGPGPLSYRAQESRPPLLPIA
jgi:hypothetical protein